MSRVIYGSVELQIVRTNRYDMEAVYDSSGTDFIGIKHKLDVGFIVNPAATSYLIGPISAPRTFPAETTKAIRQYLLTPRRTLIYEIGGYELLRCPEAGSATDAATGPKPIRCSVIRVDGARTFIGNFVIECFLPDCSGTKPVILSHRWADQHVVDERFATSRIVRGEVIFRRDILDLNGEVADDYRHQLAHPVPDSFQRRRVEVAENPSGTVLQYQIVDEQVDYALGVNSPSVKIDATFAVMSHYGKGNNAAANQVQFSGQAIGEPTGDRYLMFQQLTRVALGRLKFGAQFGENADIIVSANAKESLTTMLVGLDIVAIRQPNAQKGIAFPGHVKPPRDGEFLSVDCGPIKIDERRAPAPVHAGKLRGSWNANLVAATLGSPCTAPGSPVVVPNGKNLTLTQDGGPDIEVAQSETVTAGQLFAVLYSNETVDSGVYTDLKVDIGYFTDRCSFQVPVAGKTTSSPGKLAPTEKECVILSYAKPVTKKKVEWTAERVGAKPKLPKPESNPKMKLLRDTVQPAAFEVVADGSTVLWRVSGVYEYALEEAKEAGFDAFETAVLPIYDDPGETEIGPEQFVDYAGPIGRV